MAKIKKDTSQFRERVSTVTEEGKRNWIYATKPSGRFYKWRSYLAYFYLGIFFAMPLIHINGTQFLQFNFIEGKFSVFGKIFWPNDFFIFAIAAITAIVLIALFTAVYGRIFCGWICPQTIFMEFVFRKIEWWIEGTPAQQRKLNSMPWNAEKIIKKTVKQGLFLGFSLLIANAFLSYIIGSKVLFQKIVHPIDNIGLLFGVLVFTGMFYFVFAYVREIVCTTICPYGRLQSTLYDNDTMQVSYDYKRGEPRGKFKQKEALGLGDCIDCFRCVTVCPTGIDIRNGVQMECVGCTACIDECDDVMDLLNLPRGLIRYASENEIKSGEKSPMTLKAKAYTGLLVLMLTFLIALIASRKNVETNIFRVKGQTYQVSEDRQTVSNLFDAKVLNKTRRDIPVEFRLMDTNGDIRIVGNHEGVILKKESMNKITFFVDRPEKDVVSHSDKIKIGVYHEGALIQTVKSNFMGPFK